MGRSANRDVNLVIRARDEASRAVTSINGALQSLLGIQDQVAGSAGKTGSSLQELGDLLAQVTGIYQRVDKAAADATAAFERQSKGIANTAAELGAIEGQAAGAARALESLKAKLIDATLEGGDTAAIREQIRLVEREQGSLAKTSDRLKSSLDKQRTALEGSRSALQQTGSAANAAEKQVEELTAAIERQKAKAGSAKGNPFGLNSYQAQNLGFQVNDLATQLASGTSPLRALAQQGGQIVQIFPKVQSAIIGAFTSPAFLGAAAVLGGIALSLKKVADEAEAVRQFNATLAATADAAIYNGEALAKEAAALDRLGASSEDAVAAVRTFVKEGVNPDRLNEFGAAAQNMSDVLGIKLPDAAKQLSEGFTGGFDAIQKLDQATNAFSASQLESIRLLFEQGRASDARAEAFRIFSDRMQAAADKQEGPWSRAVKSLGGAYQSFINVLSETSVVRNMAKALEDLGFSVSAVLNKLAGATNAADITHQIDLYFRRIGELNESIAKLGDPFGAKQQQVDEYTGRIRQLTRDLAALQRQQQQPGGNGSDPRASGTAEQAKVDAALARADAERLASAKSLSAEKRVQLAHDKALLEAQDKGASDAAARRSAETAAAIERKQIAKETAQAEKQAAAAREQAIKSFSAKVIGPESSGRADAANGRSSALGLGQFIKDTWLDLFKRHFPDQAATLTDPAILALRRNGDISKKLIEVYARENAAALQKSGEAVTEANLYLAHFLGSAGALKVLKASRDTPVNQLLDKKALAANPEYLKSGGRFRTAGELRAFIGGKIGDASAAESGIVADLAKLEDQRDAKQAEFNRRIAEENAQRERGTAALKAQSGLIGDALLAEQRRQAIAEAVAQKEGELARINEELARNGQQPIEFTRQLREEVERTTGAYFDLQYARDAAQNARTAVDQPVSDLTAQRDAIQAQMRALREAGQFGFADQLKPQLETVTAKLQDAITKAREFYAELAGDPERLAQLGLTAAEVQNIQLGLQSAALAAKSFGEIAGLAFNDVAQALADSILNGINQFIEAVENGQNAIRSFGQAFLAMGANFLRMVAQMILKILALRVAMAFLKAVGFAAGAPAGGSANGLGAIGGLQAHAGGIVGRDALSRVGMGVASLFSSGPRTIDPAVFANAARFHTGGYPGLRPDEVPIIAQKGEEILSRSDPRNALNGGGSGGGKGDVKVVVAMESTDMLQHALSTSKGERVFLSFLRNNQTAIKGALDS